MMAGVVGRAPSPVRESSVPRPQWALPPPARRRRPAVAPRARNRPHRKGPAVTNLTKCLLALLLAASPAAAQEVNPNVRFGLPSPAKPDPRQREDFLIARPQYVLGYNAEKRTPNWVC